MSGQSRISQQEWADLRAQFGLCRRTAGPGAIPDVSIGAGASALAMPASHLLDPERGSAYLDRLTERLRAPSRMTAASQFVKRYAFVAAVPVLYAMTAYDKGLHARAEHCLLEATPDRWLTHIRLADDQAGSPAPGGRHAWREALLHALFAENMGPIIHMLAEIARAPKPMLWENAAVRVYSLYEKRLAASEDEAVRARGREDYAYMLHQAPGALFGEARNPLLRFYGDAAPAASLAPDCDAPSGTPTRIRKTCCFYYEVSPVEEYCTSCPKL
ncbi:(2Fe-2S)-binding protein [Paenibacillus sp. IB182496]|uniref:(2Fe-2S)-binding protein n=1 Tax=Paenibacillus sabuli TaxID=2772509 RepID=A0A927GR20_9BACL|nr:IucA/IucC family C-terminal-domain containing protein [Paenibacillus sabuli]MBD2844861.1 (2Fe-2S)-binding protein [Paenibacillus sabuli]